MIGERYNIQTQGQEVSTPEPKSLRWLLAQLKPNCGGIAERNLARQGFATFSPLERITQRNGKRLTAVKRPYFPGYLFVGIEAASAPWRAIHSTQGVARLVQFGSEPTPAPNGLVSELQQACDTEGCIAIHERLVGGDDVRIAAGPFTDFIGQVERLAPNERAWVLLDIMGKATRVSLGRSDLRKAS